MPFKNIKNFLLNKKILVFAVSAILTANLILGYSVYSYGNSEAPDEGYSAIYKLMFVLQKVRKDYVDADKASYQVLIKGAMKGMLRELDPFCSYMEPEGYKELVDDTEGREFGGVGIVVTFRNHALEVIAPMEDTPGFKAGIKSGDIIMSIDNRPTSSMTIDDCIKLLKGTPGTSVSIVIYRESEDMKREITIERANIEVSSIKGAKVIEEGIGFLRITQFNVPSAAQLDENLKKLKEQNIKALIIDLRGNPGGLLTAAAGVAELFLPYGNLIVFTKGRTGEQADQRFKSTGMTHYTDFPIVLLVNGGSASASEIVSGALQDHKRAVLVGEKTFGKGCVQSVLPLEDGAAIKLTTALYYTPSERVIQEHGIEPDVKVVMNPEDLFKIRLKQITKPADEKEKPLPGEPELRDIQLDYAIGTLKGMMIQQEWMK